MRLQGKAREESEQKVKRGRILILFSFRPPLFSGGLFLKSLVREEVKK